MTAERGSQPRVRLGLAVQASMEPRFGDRGTTQTTLSFQVDRDASMEPRFGDRGTPWSTTWNQLPTISFSGAAVR